MTSETLYSFYKLSDVYYNIYSLRQIFMIYLFVFFFFYLLFLSICCLLLMQLKLNSPVTELVACSLEIFRILLFLNLTFIIGCYINFVINYVSLNILIILLLLGFYFIEQNFRPALTEMLSWPLGRHLCSNRLLGVRGEYDKWYLPFCVDTYMWLYVWG